MRKDICSVSSTPGRQVCPGILLMPSVPMTIEMTKVTVTLVILLANSGSIFNGGC